ncbi:Mov34/MPN/PAD-1 family protein [Brevibacillus sp. TJ4]|uniref:Mov34/MPN/PAD-1 family protein n=1 Tax=Brevibacillus sp. TJ4 TaxID=3234853 RepID=UPI003BA2A806
MTALYIVPKAWKQIEQAVRKNPSLETGGVLMGYSIGEEQWVVAYASGPGPQAIQHPTSIMFDDEHLRKLVQRMSRTRSWKYIGDWHSHTMRRLTPSKGDKRTIWEKASQSMYMSPSPLMLIVGLGKQSQLRARGFILGETLREVTNLALYEPQTLRPGSSIRL